MKRDGEEVVGRDAELAAVAAALRDGAPLPRALVVEGDPGAGKTTVWRAGLRLAEEAGFEVLSARPVEGETELAFAALGDLAAAAFDRAGERLPPPQRRALAVALLREEPGPQPPDPRAIGLALLGLVRLLAAARRVLLAVDDVQWLDAPSRDALTFALRRLEGEPVAVLLARRRSAPTDAVPPPGDGLPVERVELGPLSVGAVGHLLRLRLSAAFRRPTLQRIHAISGGNPLYALELGRTFVRDGEPAPGEEVLLPRSLEALVEARLRALPKETRDVLWVASALAEPHVPLLERAVGRAVADALAPAADAVIVAVERERVEFAHPLLRSAAVSLRGAAERRALHARLARLVEGAEERGRHLALAADAPDEEDAAAIEEAAAAAAARGAALAATELAERAWRLTPDAAGVDARRRGILAAESAWVAGDYDRGRLVFEELVEAAPRGAAKAELLLRLVRQPRDIAETEELCTRGLAEAGGQPALESQLLAFRSLVRYLSGSLPAAAEDAGAALDAARATGEEARVVHASALVELIRFLEGKPVDRAVLERAAEDDLASGRPERYGATSWLLHVLGWMDELDDARRWSERYLACAEHLGEAYCGELLQGLAAVEYRAGNYDRALDALREADRAQADFGVPQVQALGLAAQGAVLVAQGRLDDARAVLDEARALAAEASDPQGELRHHWTSCFLELSRGDVEAAAAHARAGVELRRAGTGPPEDVTPVFRDAVEALAAVGDLDVAERLVADLDAAAAELSRPRRVVAAARSRAVLEAARGDLEGAERAISEALEELPRFPVPFERARTMLVAGTIARRLRRRSEARAWVARAAELFGELGAPLWLAKAQAELDRLGRRPPVGSGLTATEDRVAALAAEGLSTKEVAAALVVSPKTVEKHLTSVYAKLGVRSRSELARRWPGVAAPEDGGNPP
ncbi:MAG TPA: AAA family ATPase [Gaiellaceae bacterium]|nr:AAA family ATPase [Gaiellaceae bacterium]